MGLSFESLIQRHEMGQAYLKITEEMGPSPHLIAFVNYDDVISGALGLESLDIDQQHEMILAQIDEDESLHVACESFMGRIKSTLEKLKNGVTFTKNPSLAIMVDAKLEPKTSNIYVGHHSSFEEILKIHKQALDALNWVASKAPSARDLDGWGEFFSSHTHTNQPTEIHQVESKVTALGKTYSDLPGAAAFDSSGWNAHNFQQNIVVMGHLGDHSRSVLEHTKIMLERMEDVLNIFDDVEDVNNHRNRVKRQNHERMKEGKDFHPVGPKVREPKHNIAHALRSMHYTFEVVQAAYSLVQTCERAMVKTLTNVSHHFQIVK